MLEINKIYNENCIGDRGMCLIADKSIDMILCDLPYTFEGRQKVTGNNWDNAININKLWFEYKRIIKNDGAIVLTASQPFSSYLVMSNLDMFKYEWIWEKDNGTNFTSVNYQPFRVHENILVFGYGSTAYTKNGNYMKYNPQKTIGKPYSCKSGRKSTNLQGGDTSGWTTENNGSRYPRTVQKFNRDKEKLHPTQKPISLFEFLINSYTNEGDIILDNCIGSGTTAIACINTNRNYIGFELDDNYFNIANERIQKIRKR